MSTESCRPESARWRLLVLLLATAFLVERNDAAELTPPGGRLKTVAGGLTTVEEFENSVTRSMQKGGVTGLLVAILNDGQVVYTRQFGWRDKDAGTKLDDTTVFAGASLSKPVFAYLVMVLAEEGVIDLDKPIHKYLEKPPPGLRGPRQR